MSYDAQCGCADFNGMSDEEIVSAAKAGNDSATEYIIEKYKNLVKSRARTYFLIGAAQEDIVQEGMIGLFKAVRDLNGSKPASFKAFAELCIPRQITPAIKTATRQKHIPLNSYISLNRPVFDDDAEQTLLDTISEKKVFDPEEIVITKEHFMSLREKMSKNLSKLEWNVLSLYLDGKSYVEIAKIVKKSEKSIDNALQRIKRKVAKFLQ